MVLVCFLVAALAPRLVRGNAARPGLLLSLLPLSLLVWLIALHGAPVLSGQVIVESRPWIEGLSVAASFRLDGLSLLMSVLILGIGAPVVAYAGAHLGDDPRAGRFFAYLLSFMGAMLGLVLADNILLLFVFWELTSLTSFMLIGYNHESEKARKSAFQGLFVTVGGGLVLLAGLIVLGEAAGSYEMSGVLVSPELFAHPMAGTALALIAIGCFTKSAQFPFHFWLPNAMAAPSPVSAYLHSATMVKAGVYLLARLHPALGEHAHWFWWLVPAGAVTMLVGSAMAFRSSGVKRMLAYTTIMALGTLTLLLGLGAAAAAVTFLLAHALYKGALFLIAGIIDHEAGVKDIGQASGLARVLPVTAVFAVIAAASAAGLPPLFGFIGKELLLEEGVHAAALLAAAATIAGALVAVMVATMVLRIFFGGPVRAPVAKPHEAPAAMLAGPVLLGIGSVLFGLFPALPQQLVLAAASAAVDPAAPTLKLSLWHGLNLPLALSATSLAAAAMLFFAWSRWQPALAACSLPQRAGPEAGYWKLLDGLYWVARIQTELLQSGYLRRYVLIILLVVVVLTGGTLLMRVGIPFPAINPGLSGSIPLVVGMMVLASAMAALTTRTALEAVVAVGALGFGIALLYVWYSAPDLALTQVLIETLTTILLVLVLFRMPRFRHLSSAMERRRDAVVALALAALMTALLWMVMGVQVPHPIADWLLAESVPQGYGRNVVNVILVDFRVLDTLGEIFVLGLAAVGVYALLRQPRSEEGP